MHFDHRDPSTKQKTVSYWVAGGLIPQMLEEIARCDLVCANCHAVRTEIQAREGVIRPGRRVVLGDHNYALEHGTNVRGHNRRTVIARPWRMAVDASTKKVTPIRRVPVAGSANGSADGIIGPAMSSPGWVSLPEYSRRMRIPESSVRAMIRKGTLRAELEPRGPGDPRVVWRVWLDEPPEQPQNDPQPSAGPGVPSESPQPQTATTSDPALITAALAPLLEIVADQSETIGEERRMVAELHERIAALREQLGRTETERDTLRAELTRAQRPWWRRLLS